VTFQPFLELKISQLSILGAYSYELHYLRQIDAIFTVMATRGSMLVLCLVEFINLMTESVDDLPPAS